MDFRPPLWKQPLTLLVVVLALVGVGLLVSGRVLAGVGVVSAGSLLNAVLLLRRQIRAGDERFGRR